MRVFAAVFVLVMSSACAGGTLPSEFAQAYDTIYFADASVGYVGSSLGLGDALIKTTDGGQHWTLVRTTARDEKALYFFLSGSTFWIRAGRGLLKTADGGQTFTQMAGDYQGQDLRRQLVGSLFFVDPQNGWTWIPNDRQIAFTHDGGASWTGKLMPDRIGDVLDVWMFDAQNGIGGAMGGVIRTTDGGVHWARIPGTETLAVDTGQWSGKPVMGKLYCADARNCLGRGSRQPLRIYRTSDGGATWGLEQLPIDDVRDEFVGAQFRSPQFAVMMGEDTKEVPIAQRWIPAPRGGQMHAPIPKPNPFLLRWNGTAWVRQDITQFADPQFRSPRPFFLDSLNGWAVAYTNDIFHTTDGGQTWTVVPDYFQRILALTPTPTPFVLPTPSP